MTKPFRIFEGTFDAPGCDIHAHMMKIVGGELGATETLGHDHEYPHMAVLMRTEPPGAEGVELLWGDNLENSELMVDASRDGCNGIYVKEKVVHYVKVPPGVTAWVWCNFAKHGPNGLRGDPKAQFRQPTGEKEPWGFQTMLNAAPGAQFTEGDCEAPQPLQYNSAKDARP